MQVVEEVSKFRELRESLYASREDVIRLTKSVSLGTLRNLEKNRPIRRTNAQQLLGAINSLLANSNRSVVSLEELEIKLY